MASTTEIARLLNELKTEVAAIKAAQGNAPAGTEIVDPEAPPAKDVIKSLPPGDLQSWVENKFPDNPQAWHYAKGIGRKFVPPKTEAAMRWQLRGEDFTDALAKGLQSRAEFDKSDPLVSETAEHVRNYAGIGAAGAGAYLMFGSKRNKLPDNPNMGEIHGYVDRHNVPVSSRELPKAQFVKEIRDWEKTQTPMGKLLGPRTGPVRPSVPFGVAAGAGAAVSALTDSGDPDADVRERMSFGAGLAKADARPKPRGFRLNSVDMINRDHGPLQVEQPTPEQFDRNLG